MEADAYLPDGTPLYFKYGRAGGKSTLQLELYMSLTTDMPIDEVRIAMNGLEDKIYNTKGEEQT